MPDRYGLWALSVRGVVSAGGRLHAHSRRPVAVLVVVLGCLSAFGALELVRWAGAASGRGLWNLELGLGLGILLGYGLAYWPVVAVALAMPTLIGGVDVLIGWDETGLTAFGQGVVLGLAALAVRWISRESSDDLTERRTFLAWMTVAPAVALICPAASFLLLKLSGPSSGDAVALSLGAVVGERFWGNLAGILLAAPVSMMSPWYIAALRGRRRRPDDATQSESGRPARSCVWRVGPIALSLAGALYVVVRLGTFENSLANFVFVSVPLVAAAWGFGLLGVAPVLAAIGIAGLVAPELAADGRTSVQAAITVAAANGGVFGLLITEQRRYKATMNRQAALMDSVSFATGQLLGMTDQEKNVTEVLRNLAEHAQLDRVYVLENRHSGVGEAGFPVLYELGPDLDEDSQKVVGALRAKYIRQNAETLEQGGALQLTVEDVALGERAALRNAGIRAMLILPVFADGNWWGCLGMDQSTDVRGWSRPDVAMFEATSRVLGALLAHTNVEQQFRQFTGSIPVVFWIASPDVMHKTYVSPAYEQIWGRPREGIRENARSWMAAIYHDDYGPMSELLEANPKAAYDVEYRIVRGDRSIRWIRDTGVGVVDASGQVNRIVGIAQDITPQKEAEEQLRASEEQIRSSLTEKEVLLKEIHHRVKNNLQVISSLLSLQAGQIRDAEAAQVFRDSQYRVRAMALVHERLYQSEDLARIDFGGYVRDMTSHLLRSYKGEARGIRLNARVRGVALDVDSAIPCALIINELVSNALKYAFPDGQDGEIEVSLADEGGIAVLKISDTGVGLPQGTSLESSESLGLQLVHSLADQLGGTVECTTDGGTTFDVRFPLNGAGV